MPQEMKEGTPITTDLEEIEVVVDGEESEVQAVAEPEETTQKEDSLEEYSEGVQKRINKLTAKMREAERREQAAIEYAKSLQKQAEERIAQETKKVSQLDQYYVNEFENRLTTQNELLQNQLKEAIDRGDSESQVTLQKQMAELASQEARIKQVKQQQELQKQNPQPQQQFIPQQQPVQQQQPQQVAPDPKAEAWANKNEWFGEDEAMTITAFSIHKKLIEEEGYDPQGDEYYAQLDSRIRNEFPHKFDDVAEQKVSSSPKVAGPSRKTGTKNRKSVKLTPSQVAIAKKLNVPLEQYAAQLERMNS